MDSLLDGHELEEEIAIIEIEVGDGIVILLGTLGEILLIIDISGEDTEHLVEGLSGIDGITDPRDIGDIILLTLLDSDEDIDRLIIKLSHRVMQDLGVAITHLIILLDDSVEVILEVTIHELL